MVSTEVFATKTAAEAASISAPRIYLMDRLMYMVEAGSEPPHPLKLKDADNQWWEPEWHGEALAEWGGARRGDNQTYASANTAAIRDVHDFLVSMGGGILQFGVGYYTHNGIVVDGDGIVVRGYRPTSTADPSPSTIRGTVLRMVPNTGDGVRLMGQECSLLDFAVVSSASRAARSHDAHANGVHLEAEDTTVGNPRIVSAIVKNVLVRDQPGSGFVMAGRGVTNRFGNITASQCGGHGIVIDNGEYVERTNLSSYTGIMDIVQGRFTDNGGHAICLGSPTTSNLVYRIGMAQAEAYRNGKTPSVRHEPATFYFNGDGITLDRSAGTGYSEDVHRDDPDLGIVYMTGRCHRYEGNRLYRSANPVVAIGGSGNEDIRILGNRTFSNADNARFVKVDASGTTYGLEVSQIAGDDFDQLVQQVTPVVGLIMQEKDEPLIVDEAASTSPIAAPMAEATSAQLASVTAAINTTGKYKGKLCFVTDTNGFVVSAGNGASASWRYSDGTIAYNP